MKIAAVLRSGARRAVRRRVASSLLAAAMAATGCTHLEVYKIGPEAGLPKLDDMIFYALPQRTFLITTAYLVKECGTVKSGKLDVELSATVTSAAELDPDERYYIRLKPLRSVFKETSITVDSHANGTLKAFSGTIVDQAGPIITATIGTAMKIAGAATGGGMLLAEDLDEAAPLCRPHIHEALLTLALKKQELAALISAGDKKQGLIETKAAGLQAEIAALKAALTTKTLRTWTPAADALQAVPGTRLYAATIHEDAAQGIRQLLSSEGISWLEQELKKPKEKAAWGAKTIYVELSLPERSRPASQADVAISPGGPHRGLVLRNPALTTMRVCKGECPPLSEEAVRLDNTILSATVPVPQFGPRVILPLSNPMFRNDTLEVTVAEDGMLTRIGMKAASTVAASIAALGGAADTGKSIVEGRHKASQEAEKEKLNKVHDDNKRVAECLEYQKKIREGGGTVIGVCE